MDQIQIGVPNFNQTQISSWKYPVYPVKVSPGRQEAPEVDAEVLLEVPGSEKLEEARSFCWSSPVDPSWKSWCS